MFMAFRGKAKTVLSGQTWRAILMNCLMTLIRLVALGSLTISLMVHIISLLTSSQKRERLGVPYPDLSSKRSSTYSVASICRKVVKSSTISWVETSTGFS